MALIELSEGLMRPGLLTLRSFTNRLLLRTEAFNRARLRSPQLDNATLLISTMSPSLL